jgi:hypothetical protein
LYNCRNGIDIMTSIVYIQEEKFTEVCHKTSHN